MTNKETLKDIQLKNPQNSANIKNTVSDIPRDFTNGTDFCADVTANQFIPIKKTKLEKE